MIRPLLPLVLLLAPVAALGQALPLAVGEEGSDLSARRPSGIAVLDGRLAVSDRASGRVYLTDPDGAVLSVLVEKGTEPGRVLRPSALGADPLRNRLYVADEGARRVAAFDLEDGRAEFAWESRGDRAGFRRPVSIAVDPEGGIYVADEEGASLFVLSPDDGTAVRVRETGSGGALIKPIAVAAAGDGRVFVLDFSRRRIFAYSSGDGRPLGVEIPVDRMHDPGALAVTRQCELLVLDRHAVHVATTGGVVDGERFRAIPLGLRLDGRWKSLSVEGRDRVLAADGSSLVRVALPGLDPSREPCVPEAPVRRFAVDMVEPDLLLPGREATLLVLGSGFGGGVSLDAGPFPVRELTVVSPETLRVRIEVPADASPGEVGLSFAGAAGEEARAAVRVLEPAPEPEGAEAEEERPVPAREPPVEAEDLAEMTAPADTATAAVAGGNPPRPPESSPGGRPLGVVLLGLAAAVLAGGGAYLLRRRPGRPRARFEVTVSRVETVARGAVVPVRPRSTLLGRSEEASPRFGHPWISRTHARVERKNGDWWITDLSRNGTFVDGRRLERDESCAVKDGALVSLARVVELRFRSG